VAQGTNILQFPFISVGNVRAEIKRIASEDTINLVLLNHAKDRMDRRDITMRQIQNVLKNGELLEAIKWCSDKECGWRCKLRRVTAGAEVTVVAKLVKRAENTCLVITTWEG